MRIEFAQPEVAQVAASGKSRRWPLVIGGVLLVALGVGAGYLFAPAPSGRKSQMPSMARSVTGWLDSSVVAGLPNLILDVKFRHIDALRDRRHAWAQQGVRIAGDNESTPASVRVGGQTVEVGVALAGGPRDSGPGELGRLRLSVKSEGDLWGMKRMVLDDPERPGFVQEAMFYGALQRAGLLSPRMQAAQLTINGKVQEVAVAVEQPGIEGLQRAGRLDSVMVGWDPSLTPGGNADSAAWLDPRVIAPQVEGGAKRLLGTPLAEQAGLAVSLLRDLALGVLSADEVVDIEKTARFAAICDVWAQARALQWNASRWVMHPVTLRLEPYVRLPAAGEGRLADGYVLLQRLMESKMFRAAYETALREEAQRVATPQQMALLQKQLGVTVPGLADADALAAVAEVRARARQVLDVQKLKLVPGVEVAAVAHPLVGPGPIGAALPFARIDVQAKRVTVPAGTWDVAETAQVPNGYTLQFVAGAQVRFAAGTWLIVRGPVQCEGTAEAPVVLQGRDQDGKREAWGGLMIENGDGSKWRHVRIEDASAVGLGVWQPQASVIWVESDAVIEDLELRQLGGTIAAMRSVGGTMKLRRVQVNTASGGGLQFANTQADLAELRFQSVRGDAVDVAGGKVRMAGMHARDVGGAALWASQSAQVEVVGVDAERVGSGFIARDGARIRASASRISGARHLGYLAYNQTAGATGARIDAIDVKIVGARQNHLCTGGGAVAVEGRMQVCSAVSVQQLVAAGITRK